MINKLYDTSLSLLTDLYQLTMAYGYWKSGATQPAQDEPIQAGPIQAGPIQAGPIQAGQEAVFNLYFRKNPFAGGFTLACGLANVIGYINNFGFSKKDLRYLKTLTGNDSLPLFEDAFLTYLAELKLTVDIDAMPEGTVVFPNEPLVRVRGPILQCQLLETPLLNLINFESLIATKAARLRLAAGSDTLLEFGLRRAQGADGGMTASRAAYIGGCDATSNVLAGKLYGIPVRGTHAHSWVMSFDSEQEAFDAYADRMPNNVTLLVDTYDTLRGVGHAIETGRKLRDRGHRLAGIRLDSGDLAYLSIEARKLLDDAGFTDTLIVASNDLDETIIGSLKQQGARIDVWGVGTKLVTAYDQPALGGVYKVAAIRNRQGHVTGIAPECRPGRDHRVTGIAPAHRPGRDHWDYKMKLSEQAAKTSTPGIQQVRRFRDERGFVADMIFDEEISAREPAGDTATMIDPLDFTKRRRFDAGQPFDDLLIPVFRAGKQVYECPDIHAARARVQNQLVRLHPGVTRFINPHTYPVGLEKSLHELKTELTLKLREG